MKKITGIIESPVAPSENMLWINKGSLKFFNKGVWEELGNKEIEENRDVKYLPFISLIQGNSNNTREYNLKNLVQGISFVLLDNGYGVCNWDSNSGGYVNIITSSGNNIQYRITKNGSITKISETVNLYLVLDFLNCTL